MHKYKLVNVRRVRLVHMFSQVKPQRQNQSTSGHEIYPNMISDQQGQSKQCIKGINGISADPEMSYTKFLPAKYFSDIFSNNSELLSQVV